MTWRNWWWWNEHEGTVCRGLPRKHHRWAAGVANPISVDEDNRDCCSSVTVAFLAREHRTAAEAGPDTTRTPLNQHRIGRLGPLECTGHVTPWPMRRSRVLPRLPPPCDRTRKNPTCTRIARHGRKVRMPQQVPGSFATLLIHSLQHAADETQHCHPWAPALRRVRTRFSGMGDDPARSRPHQYLSGRNGPGQRP